MFAFVELSDLALVPVKSVTLVCVRSSSSAEKQRLQQRVAQESAS